MFQVREPDEFRARRRDVERRMNSILRCGAAPGQEFDLFAAVDSISKHDRFTPKNAGAERVWNLHHETAAVYGATHRGHLRLPLEYFARDLIAGTGTSGGYLAGSGPRPPGSEVVDALRPISLAARLGVPVIIGIKEWGSLTIPRASTNAVASWVAENVAPSQAATVFDAGVTLVPSTVTLHQSFSRKLAQSSSADMERWMTWHLLAGVMQEIDRALLAGSGSGSEPAGILNASGTTLEALGTNGAALALANLVAMEKAASSANAQQVAFVSNPAVRAKLRTSTGINEALWNSADRVAGAQAFATTAMPSTLTKGTSTGICSAAITGDFANGAVIGIHGAIDLLIDKYTAATSGAVRVVAIADVAIALRHPAAFAVSRDILTT